MTKNDLKNGSIVELRNGDKFIFLRNIKNDFFKDCLISLESGCYINFDDYNNDLKDNINRKYDIVKVCQNDYVGDNFRDHIINNTQNWTWIRKENKLKSNIKRLFTRFLK